MSQLRRYYANAIRALSMDAVQNAKSGHPGMPMGMADIAEVLWRDYLKHNPTNPKWFDRDRFVLSNGHGSMLLYSLLHLSGYDLPITELENFRQLGSKTPGHPEWHETPGVETTTGPLGQGLANGVGMALAESMLAAHFNRDGFDLVDHYTYVFCGDGCLMEGVSHEACSLAGSWGLGKLIVFWDDNGISIDGETKDWFADNTPERFKAYGWQVIDKVDGHDAESIKKAIDKARSNLDQPTLICCKTQIGFGSPNKVNTAGAHGAPLGDDEISLTREALEWPFAPFEIPEDVQEAWDARELGLENEREWNKLFAKYESAHKDLAEEFLRRMGGYLPENMAVTMQELIQASMSQAPEATRKSSGALIADMAKHMPELLGGSSDLSGSNCTSWKAMVPYTKEHKDANYIYYGVREFAMSAIMNGVSLHKGYVPFGGTFLVFSDYARNAVRMSALMQQKVIYVYSHDSIGLGEDGPTHQPISHAASLRLMPGVHVWRPCDKTETAVAWNSALHYQGPSALLLTRQNVPAQVQADTLENVQRGGYILHEPDTEMDGILIATGSEVALAMDAAKVLAEKGVMMRVVSMPCVERFLEQDMLYQQRVLPVDATLRVAVEAGATGTWYQFVGLQGAVIGIDRFGISAPIDAVYEKLDVTVAHIVDTVLAKHQLLA